MDPEVERSARILAMHMWCRRRAIRLEFERMSLSKREREAVARGEAIRRSVIWDDYDEVATDKQLRDCWPDKIFAYWHPEVSVWTRGGPVQLVERAFVLDLT